MSIFSRFRSLDDDGKAQAVRKLMSASTPSFDYFYMAALAVSMATLGLLLNNASIVIGSALIAPVLYPILSLSLGLVMSDYRILVRAAYTILKSIGMAVGIAAAITLLFAGNAPITAHAAELVAPSLLYLFVAFFAGLGVSYVLARPDWNATIPGLAISVAFIPPAAAVGIGLAHLDVGLALGAFMMLGVNIIGIVAASMATFSLMNLYEKRHIAQSAIEKAEEKVEEEQAVIAALDHAEQSHQRRYYPRK